MHLRLKAQRRIERDTTQGELMVTKTTRRGRFVQVASQQHDSLTIRGLVRSPPPSFSCFTLSSSTSPQHGSVDLAASGSLKWKRAKPAISPEQTMQKSSTDPGRQAREFVDVRAQRRDELDQHAHEEDAKTAKGILRATVQGPVSEQQVDTLRIPLSFLHDGDEALHEHARALSVAIAGGGGVRGSRNTLRSAIDAISGVIVSAHAHLIGIHRLVVFVVPANSIRSTRTRVAHRGEVALLVLLLAPQPEMSSTGRGQQCRELVGGRGLRCSQWRALLGFKLVIGRKGNSFLGYDRIHRRQVHLSVPAARGAALGGQIGQQGMWRSAEGFAQHRRQPSLRAIAHQDDQRILFGQDLRARAIRQFQIKARRLRDLRGIVIAHSHGNHQSGIDMIVQGSCAGGFQFAG
eukprot:scaffold1193_cov159-Ochromonas_danica.AAC.25